MFRVIQEFKPAWVINENPTGRLTMDFHEVLSDLESIGYETRSFVIPACAVNAYHRRDRIFIIANTAKFRYDNTNFPNPRTNISQEQKVRKRYNRWDETNRYPKVEDGVIEGIRLEDESTLLPLVYGVPGGLVNPQVKACGNAVVPQQIYPILKAIADIEYND